MLIILTKVKEEIKKKSKYFIVSQKYFSIIY